jgi:hypothetical protein
VSDLCGLVAGQVHKKRTSANGSIVSPSLNPIKWITLVKDFVVKHYATHLAIVVKCNSQLWIGVDVFN